MSATTAGQAAIAAHAVNSADFVDAAIEAIYELRESRLLRGHFTVEELRAELRIPRPKELRAWGAVTVRAVREGLIEQTSEFRPAASSRGSMKPVYRWAPKRVMRP